MIDVFKLSLNALSSSGKMTTVTLFPIQPRLTYLIRNFFKRKDEKVFTMTENEQCSKFIIIKFTAINQATGALDQKNNELVKKY